MSEIINTPLFGILLCIFSYEIGVFINRKTKSAVLNPLLIAIVLCIAFLSVFGISYESFNIGGEYITFLLTPATVVLAIPLYKKINLLKKDLVPILVGITVGSITAIVSVIVLSNVFGLTDTMALSMVPKSVTTAIGVDVSAQIGGIVPITTVAIIVTGILGAVLAPFLCRVFKIKDKVAIGVAIGTSSHAVGTSKAIEMGETEGAMSAASISIAGIITAIIAPIIVMIFM